MTTTTNPYEAEARTRKACALYAWLATTGRTAAEAAGFPADARRIVATLAGVKPPTDGDWDNWRTWNQAVELLSRHGDIQTATARALARLQAS